MGLRSIQVSSLLSGSVAVSNYYSEKGELLISQGITITDTYLETFKRRNIFEVFTKPATEEEELNTILSKEFKSLGDVDIDDQVVQKIPDLRAVKAGQDGLKQLIRSEKAFLLDKQLSASGRQAHWSRA